MNPYNGFTSAQRSKALAWLNKEYAAGRRHRPTQCEACGQTEGVVDAHSEDYSQPFGAHIGAHRLCFRCHMMVHCRFKNPKAWALYKAQVRNGKIFRPFMTRNFGGFVSETITKYGAGVPFTLRAGRGATFLDTLQ